MGTLQKRSWAEYCAIKRMNPSTLKHGRRSMLRLKRAIDGECQPKPENVIVGNAAHCMIAGEYEDRYQVMPPFEFDQENVTTTGKPSNAKTTNYYKEAAEQWRAEMLKAGREEITEVQAATAAKIANQVRRHCGSMIDSSEQEVTVFGEIECVPMKTRLDGLWNNLVWDLKTTNNADDYLFYRNFKAMGYGFSAAVHVELLRQNGINVEQYLIIAAESQDDYDVRVLTVPMELLDVELSRVRNVATQYRIALETDYWPGLGDGPLVVPNWDMASDDELEWGE